MAINIDPVIHITHDNLLNFRGEHMPTEIPKKNMKDNYKLLWGAGDIWQLPQEFFDLYDIFVSFGMAEYGHGFGNPPVSGLTYPGRGVFGNSIIVSNSVLLENLKQAHAKGKLLVFIDIKNDRQKTAFQTLFEDKISLFEELGVHNELSDSEGRFCDKLLQTGYKNTINLSNLDFNLDGLLHPMLINPREGDDASPIIPEKIGKDKRYINARFYQLNNGIREPYTNDDKLEELKTFIKAYDKRSYFYTHFNYIHINEELIDGLTLEEANFVSVVLNNLSATIPRIYMTNKYVISFNKTPRLYSDKNILRISFHKVMSRLGPNYTKRYFENYNADGGSSGPARAGRRRVSRRNSRRRRTLNRKHK